MKRFSFFLALALILSFGLANAGQVVLDTVYGVWADGKIQPNQPVTFVIRLINDNTANAGGITNGFVVYTDAGNFTPVVGDTIPVTPGWKQMFDLVFSINHFGCDGVGRDTVGFGGSKMLSTGLPVGFNKLSYTLTTGGVDSGSTICIDSTYYPPTGSWLWAPGGAPSWSGVACFLAEQAPDLPPTVTCPGDMTFTGHCTVVSGAVSAVDPDPDGSTLTVTASKGTVTGGTWSYQPTIGDVGTQTITITATESDGPVGTCTFNVTFGNTAPTANCGALLTVSTGTVSTFTVVGADADGCDVTALAYTIDGFTTDNASIAGNVVTFSEATAGAYTITVMVSDGLASVTCTKAINVQAGSMYQTGIGVVGDQDANTVFPGQHVNVPVTAVAAATEIGGYKMVLAYDASVLSFQSATMGSALVACGWEYFTYRFGADGNCGTGCPSGLLTVVAIAETNNGPDHPTCFDVAGEVLFNLDFLVSSDNSFDCTFAPIRFFWTECGDNTLSNVAGDELHIAEAVYDGYDPLTFNLMMDIIDGTTGYPTYTGPQASDCTENDRLIADVSFANGGVWLACVGTLGYRGDINLNEVSYEIADAVLFSNYFIYGLGVFNIDQPKQIAATDVNADGLTLSVADLVYLIRVVVGDAVPYPKLSPVATTATTDRGMITVADRMGAAYVVVDGNVTPTLISSNMEMKYAFDAAANVTRVLVWSQASETFSGHFLTVNGNVNSVEFATPEGATVSAKILPSAFALKQNYPNPFNPTTTISFALPVASQYNLTVYNIAGQKVTEFNGSAEAGIVEVEWDASNQASGVYFYKLNAGNFNDTKKMLFLK